MNNRIYFLYLSVSGSYLYIKYVYLALFLLDNAKISIISLRCKFIILMV